MSKKILHFALFLAALTLAFPTQQPAQDVQPQARAVTVNGITIPAIPDAPFSATVVLEFERYWPDGSTQIRRTINLVARDSQGRTHNETRRLKLESFHGSPELMSVRLFDPITRTRTVCDTSLHIAHQQSIPKQPKTASTPNPLLHVEELGTDTLNGLKAKGTRRTLSVYGDRRGDGAPIEVVDEDWYSEDLHINLLVRHFDPRVGVQTVGISNLRREEPPASMFQVPLGYKIVDETPVPEPTVPEPPAAGAVPNP
ncbi:MAG: hypothetical protein ABSG96_17655 [Terracidiphilus sp.]|jgi:hypothetical protein